MIKEQQSVDETIERFRRDRQMIKDRMNDRNLLFSKATQNYLQSVQREIETIRKTQNISATRNNEFRSQINNLYKRYEGGSERLRLAIQKTNIEKINYNNYLIKVYPHNYTSERQKLLEENQRLKELLQGIRPNIIEDPIYIQDRDQQEDFQEYQDQLDHFIQPSQEQEQQQQQQQKQQQQQQSQQQKQQQKIKPFDNSLHSHQPSNSQTPDYLDQFLIPQNNNNKF